jgi:hypothetical protein
MTKETPPSSESWLAHGLNPSPYAECCEKLCRIKTVIATYNLFDHSVLLEIEDILHE